jgi:hypothetical protein
MTNDEKSQDVPPRPEDEAAPARAEAPVDPVAEALALLTASGTS